MKVVITLLAGPDKEEPTKSDMDKNIEALQRYKEGKETVADQLLMVDTISILKGIREQLPVMRAW